MMGDSIHKTHFQVPEMPWREKEKQAILLFKRIVGKYNKIIGREEDDYYSIDELGVDVIAIMDTCSQELIDWVMKYKGE